MVNDVPQDYYAGVDMTTGRRTDGGMRPELTQGSVEYVAPPEYRVPLPTARLCRQEDQCRSGSKIRGRVSRPQL